MFNFQKTPYTVFVNHKFRQTNKSIKPKLKTRIIKFCFATLSTVVMQQSWNIAFNIPIENRWGESPKIDYENYFRIPFGWLHNIRVEYQKLITNNGRRCQDRSQLSFLLNTILFHRSSALYKIMVRLSKYI